MGSGSDPAHPRSQRAEIRERTQCFVIGRVSSTMRILYLEYTSPKPWSPESLNEPCVKRFRDAQLQVGPHWDLGTPSSQFASEFDKLL